MEGPVRGTFKGTLRVSGLGSRGTIMFRHVNQIWGLESYGFRV